MSRLYARALKEKDMALVRQTRQERDNNGAMALRVVAMTFQGNRHSSFSNFVKEVLITVLVAKQLLSWIILVLIW